MTRPRFLAAAALAAAFTLTPAAAMGQQSVEECVAQGGPRYGVPGDATIHQYVDAGGRCADAQEEDEVTITPVGEDGGPATPNGAQPGGNVTTPNSPTSPNPATGGGEGSNPGSPATPGTPATPSSSGTPQPGQGTAGARGPAAASAVQAALAAGGQAEGASLPAGIGSLPGGVTALVLAALGLAGAGIGARRLGRN